MAQFEHDMTKNHISFIRFGGSGAAGSESWMTGAKMKPYQIQKLRELLKSVEQETPSVKPQKIDENLTNMFD